mgnify:CR=1 FL=1
MRCNVLVILQYVSLFFFFFQAEDGIRDLVRSRGLGDVYKRQDVIYEAYLACIMNIRIVCQQFETFLRFFPFVFQFLSLIHI